MKYRNIDIDPHPGNRSRELERYEHLSPVLKRQTVELIAKVHTDTASDTVDSEREEKSSEVKGMAGTTGLEPATSDVTGRRSNQLNYVPAITRLFHANTPIAPPPPQR